MLFLETYLLWEATRSIVGVNHTRVTMKLRGFDGLTQLGVTIRRKRVHQISLFALMTPSITLQTLLPVFALLAELVATI